MYRIYAIMAFVFSMSLSGGASAVDLNGQVQTDNGTPVCALVLASGRSVFSCNPRGPFSLPGLFTEPDGSINLQVYARGFLPYFEKLTSFGFQTVIMQRAGAPVIDNGLSDFSPVDGTYRLLRFSNIDNFGIGIDTADFPSVQLDGQMWISGNQIVQNAQAVIDGQVFSFSQSGTFFDTGTALNVSRNPGGLNVITYLIERRSRKLTLFLNNTSVGGFSAEVQQWELQTGAAAASVMSQSADTVESSFGDLGEFLRSLVDAGLLPNKSAQISE